MAFRQKGREGKRKEGKRQEYIWQRLMRARGRDGGRRAAATALAFLPWLWCVRSWTLAQGRKKQKGVPPLFLPLSQPSGFFCACPPPTSSLPFQDSNTSEKGQDTVQDPGLWVPGPSLLLTGCVDFGQVMLHLGGGGLGFPSIKWPCCPARLAL